LAKLIFKHAKSSIKDRRIIALTDKHIKNQGSRNTAQKNKKGIAKKGEDFPAWRNASSSERFGILGRYYHDKGQLDKAEQLFKAALAIDPSNEIFYFLLGRTYYERQMYKEAAKAFEKLHNIDPSDTKALNMLGVCYRQLGLFRKIEPTLSESIKLNPRNDEACSLLAGWYTELGMYARAERLYKRAIEVNPKSRLRYSQLGMCYMKQGKYEKAIDLFTEVINGENGPEKERFYNGLAYAYSKMGNENMANIMHEKANYRKMNRYNPKTRSNYRKIADILRDRGIKLVCVQYPRCGIEPLKKILNGKNSIIFVDNESVFEKAIGNEDYHKYFTDYFAGDWGHCTKEGNRILAENIAKTIKREYFIDKLD
jgi:tetratricopeptide (TPR) repeat protein